MNFSRLVLAVLLPCHVGCSGEGDETLDGAMPEASGGTVDSETPGTDDSTAPGGALASGGTTASTGAETDGAASGGSEPASGGSTVASGGTTAGAPVTARVMSLNVYGHATMPQEAGTYAALIENHDIDVVGIQEGVNDWMLATDLPTDYSRADALGAALGECWEQRYQIFVNTCNGFSWVSHERFDLTDGPNATRTGERAIVSKDGTEFTLIDIHWDHEDASARSANATETSTAANLVPGAPTIVLGDFNAGCDAGEPTAMATGASLSLVVNAGIDCIFSRGTTGTGVQVTATPSDHPGVVAELSF